MVSFLQPNHSAQAAALRCRGPESSARRSGPDTRTSHEPLSSLWCTSQPIPGLRCTADPLSPGPTHQRFQQQPGSIQRPPTDPLPTSPHPTWCSQVWLFVIISFFLGVYNFLELFVIYFVTNLLSSLPQKSQASFLTIDSHPIFIYFIYSCNSISSQCFFFSLSSSLSVLNSLSVGVVMVSLLSHRLTPCSPSSLPRCSRRPPGAPSHRPTIIRPAEPSLLD